MTVTDEQVIRDRLDLEMLERPHLWPSKLLGIPCVYVRRGQTAAPGEGETGPCMKLEDGSYQVLSHDWTRGGGRTNLHYADAEAVYDDGWRVD